MGTAIVMVIFWSAAVFKRLLSQKVLDINPVFVINGKT